VQYQESLTIEVLSSNTLRKGARYCLKHTGYEESQRNGNDGHIFFGSKKRSAVEGFQRKGLVINDIVIPVLNQGSNEKARGNHFVIWYDSGYFKIKDLAVGFGLYLKIREKCALDENMLIHVGESYFVCNFIDRGDGGAPTLRLKLFGGP
jgi:hypothetical protein